MCLRVVDLKAGCHFLLPQHSEDSNPLLYSMGSYYDVDAILTDAQKVPCTFDLDMPGLGYLDENAGGDVQFPHSPSFFQLLI